MSRIPEDTIQAVRDRIDIVDLVGRYVGLKKAGRTFKGLCPFHQEKTPSFVVTPERGTYHCFGCGEGGNAFGFLMRHENLTFPEAVRLLAAEVGVEVAESGAGEPGVVEAVTRANEIAWAFYREALSGPEGAGARAYLAERGLDPAESERFGIGFAPDRWEALAARLRREGVPPAVGVRAGLLRERERGGVYDLLRGRVVFPIQDVRGRVIGFGGRALASDQEPKYLNTPESPVFRKREAFYGFPTALAPIREHDRAVVVEGYFDRIALHRAGIQEAIATCGTALAQEHARSLRRRARQVLLLFDGDEAGRKAMLRALEVLLPQGLRVRAAELPGGVDPDDFLREQGEAALRRLVDEAPPALELAIERAVARGIGSPWERADAVEAVLPLVAAVPDPVERGEWARRLALATGVEAPDVEAALRRRSQGDETAEIQVPAAPRRLSRQEAHYREALGHLLCHPHLAGRISREALLAEAPDADWRLLAETLLEEARRDGDAIDAAGLLDRLQGELRARLAALAAGDDLSEGDAERALRAIHEILASLGSRRARNEARAVTRKIETAGSGGLALLQEKQRQLERRRESLGDVSPGR